MSSKITRNYYFRRPTKRQWLPSFLWLMMTMGSTTVFPPSTGGQEETGRRINHIAAATMMTGIRGKKGVGLSQRGRRLPRHRHRHQLRPSSLDLDPSTSQSNSNTSNSSSSSSRTNHPNYNNSNSKNRTFYSSSSSSSAVPAFQETAKHSSMLFPGVYILDIPKADIVSPFYKQRIAEMDLLHVDCTIPTSTTSIHNTTSSSSSSSSCQVQVLLHSPDEHIYFHQVHQLSLQYHPEATKAIVPRSLLSTTPSTTMSSRRKDDPTLGGRPHRLPDHDPDDAIHAANHRNDAATTTIIADEVERSDDVRTGTGTGTGESSSSSSSSNGKQRRRTEEVLSSTVGYTTIQGLTCYLDYQGMMDWLQELVSDFNNNSRTSSSSSSNGAGGNDSNGGTGSDAYSNLYMELIDIGDSYLKAESMIASDNSNNKTNTSTSTTTSNGGSTSVGHDILAFHLTAANHTSVTANKATLAILTGIHPREYAPPELIRQWLLHSMMDWNNIEARTILQSTDIYWIPYANPDGRVLAETTQPYRRKNLNPRGTGLEDDDDDDDPVVVCSEDESGVDLNRNFPFRWGDDDGSSDHPCMQTYRGSSAASEPETQAVVNFLLNKFPASQRPPPGTFELDNEDDSRTMGYNESLVTGLFLDIHSYGNYYVYPWGFDNLQTPNHEGFTAMAQKLSTFTGYSVRGPGMEYTTPASGATDDWAYATLGAAGMTWEVGTDFFQDCATFESSIVPSSMNALMYAAKVARHPFQLSRGPDIVNLQRHLGDEEDGGGDALEYPQGLTLTFQVSSAVDLQAANQSAALEVQSVLVYIDQHPYATESIDEMVSPHWSMDAEQINEDPEAAATGIGSIAWTWSTLETHWKSRGLPMEGEHIFYLIAVDTGGYPGPMALLSIMVGQGPTPGPTVSLTPSPSIIAVASGTTRTTSSPTTLVGKSQTTEVPTTAPMTMATINRPIDRNDGCGSTVTQRNGVGSLCDLAPIEDAKELADSGQTENNGDPPLLATIEDESEVPVASSSTANPDKFHYFTATARSLWLTMQHLVVLLLPMMVP